MQELYAPEEVSHGQDDIGDLATQQALVLINGIATKVPMIASTAKISEMTKTAVVGGDKFISTRLLIDARNVIVFSQKAPLGPACD